MSSEDSDSNDDHDHTDDNKPQKEYHLGRFCAARAQTFHRFSHWEVRCQISNHLWPTGYRFDVAVVSPFPGPSPRSRSPSDLQWQT